MVAADIDRLLGLSDNSSVESDIPQDDIEGTYDGAAEMDEWLRRDLAVTLDRKLPPTNPAWLTEDSDESVSHSVNDQNQGLSADLAQQTQE